MSTQTLLLTPWMTPHKIVSWKTAITLFFLEKVDVLEEYDEAISSPSVTLRAPAVARLKRPFGGVKRGVKFSRVNLFTRDAFRCQYCGQRKAPRELSYDHVVPRHKGGKTLWENIVAACHPCNSHKGSRTPAEAGMRLLRKPYRPKTLPLSILAIDSRSIPEIWSPYCASATSVEESKGGFFLIAS